MHNDINNNNQTNGNIRSEIEHMAGEHSAAIRAFALLVAGTAIGLIFNAVCGYEYSAALIGRAKEMFRRPFEGTSGVFDVLKCVTEASAVDVVLFLLVALFGVSYICRQGCTLLIMARGVGLGVSVGVLATLAAGDVFETKHGGACAVAYFLFSSLLSVMLVFFSVFAERASVVFHSLFEMNSGGVFTARFGTYLIICIAAEGAVLITKAIYLLVIHLLTM